MRLMFGRSMLSSALVALSAMLAAPPAAVRLSAQAPTTPAPRTMTPAKPETGKAEVAKAPAKPNPPGFDALAKKADAAREAGELEAAIDLYRRALKLKPSWIEGHWSLGTILYDLDRFAEARDSFRRVVLRSKEHGPAWGMKGLCEYRLKNYDTALEDLVRARTFGIPVKDLAGVVRYHAAILNTRNEDYERALQMLGEFASEGNDAPGVIEAMGIAALRMPILPPDLPGERREMVMMAGRASYFMAARMVEPARTAFEALVGRYPEAPNVHYAYGVFLLPERPDRAIEEFKRELKISPNHVWSKIQIAYEYIRRGDYQSAKPWAEEAVAMDPTQFVARNALGQVLLETGDVDGAIAQLQEGVKIAPDSPSLRFTLARAYQRAGRAADAERERAEFRRLDRIYRTARSGSQSVGGIEDPGEPPAAVPDAKPKTPPDSRPR